MTAIIGAKQDKVESIALLEQILHRFILNGVNPAVAKSIGEHIGWMLRQPNDLNVNCKLETVPELGMTRVVLEYSFAPIPGLKTN